jgi:hypothetical protein
MNKKFKLVWILTLLGMSIIAFSAMYFLFNWSLKKSLIISGGAAIAMLIADSIAFYYMQKKKTHDENTLNSDSTNPNTP